MRLQNRWRIEGNYLVYYGIRRKPFTNHNRIKLSNKDLLWLNNLDNYPSTKLKKSQTRLINEGIVVDDSQYSPLKESFDDAVFCKKCCANDFAIPGLEFNVDGICPICDNYNITKDFVSINPVVEEIPVNYQGMYDVAVFYTGGKDSTFMLWYLAKVKNLRVLALTWRLPFISDSAAQSIKNAKIIFSNVSFVEWQVSDLELSKFYNKLFELQNNTCACPSLAYLLFFPILSGLKVPYIVLGNEPSQIKNLYFNNIAPAIAFKYHYSKTISGLLKLYRLLTFKKPVTIAQYSYLMVIKQLINGDNFIKRKFSNKFQSLNNINIALDEMKGLKPMLRHAVHMADRSGSFSALVQFDFNAICGGSYCWANIKDTLINEAGWVDTASIDKGLHTSCCVERGKEYSQFINFRNMNTSNIPFTAIELACAVHELSINRDDAIAEMRNSCGFSLIPPHEHCEMRAYIDKYNK